MKEQWCITKDHLDDDEIKINEFTEDMVVKVRLYDDDDILYYSGYMTQELMDDGENAFEPLDWGMPVSGCTSMQYKEPGKGWETL